MQVKLIMNWDINDDLNKKYLEFVMSEFVPSLARLGIRPVEAWYTLYGNYPQIMMGGITDDVETMKKILASPEWHELREKLLEYVSNFHHKVIHLSPFFPVG